MEVALKSHHNAESIASSSNMAAAVEDECIQSIDGSHASSSEDEFEKELNLLEQRKPFGQAISSTLYANAQIKLKVTSSIEKMERLGRLQADSVWKIIGTLDEPLLTRAKIFGALPVIQVSVERLFSSMKFILSDHRASMKQDILDPVLFLRANGQLDEETIRLMEIMRS